MNDHLEPPDDDDQALAAAGAELRATAQPIAPGEVQAAVWRRRTHGVGAVAVASLAVVALLGGLLIAGNGSDRSGELASARDGAPSAGDVELLLSALDDRPVDPTTVELVATVSTFASCDALIGDLRRVGAEHVGSRGFGGNDVVGFGYGLRAFDESSRAMSEQPDAMPTSGASDGAASGGDSVTLGTNVQVAGVDEPDVVKAEGNLIYDLDGRGNLRITDARSLTVVSTLDVSPSQEDDDGSGPQGGNAVRELLVANARVAVFGSEVEVSAPVEGDPSATQTTSEFMTMTLVDATNPAEPNVTDRVRVEGSLVSARLVGDEIRMVTTSNMADLGFVVPTTANSVGKALEMNRRSVASSTVDDWIPQWQRDGDEPEPLVPCEQVYVPDTFAGVAMTSMVTVGLGAGRFDPLGTSILAPATTLYAGTEVVAVSSEVWVDPIDRGRLEFDDWRTAIHEFRFADASPPSYDGSAIVDGSTIGQFAFGEIGGSVAVVTATGSPWQADTSAGIDLTVLTPDGNGSLTQTASVSDLADGAGVVNAVRFVGDRVLVSTGGFDSQDRTQDPSQGLVPGGTGLFSQRMVVIDVTDPADPRRAGTLTVGGEVGYFHPLPDNRALAIGSRYDEVGQGLSRQTRTWVDVQLLDVSDPDAPAVVGTWEQPWVTDNLGWDHRAFTWWPDRSLAMWGLQTTGPGFEDLVNQAAVLLVGDGVDAVAVPQVSPPSQVDAPCPILELTDVVAQSMVGPDSVVLRCAGDVADGDSSDGGGVEWPRYQCYRVDEFTVSRFVPDDGDAVYVVCSPAPNPVVSRVLVVAGVPILYTNQTLETLDPVTFASTAVAYHPSGGLYDGQR
jgi:hypothetical protein